MDASGYGRWSGGVPRDLAGNAAYRLRVLNLCGSGGGLPYEEVLENRRVVRRICAEDLSYYVNVFCWTYDPRKSGGAVPFVLYPYQERALRELVAALGEEDLLVEKSRDMGASWLFMVLLDWRCRFHGGESYLLGSRNESYVEQKGNEKALFSKLDYLVRWTPEWMRPRYERKKMHMENLDNGTKINGESTTGDFARGDRRTAVLLDEFAAVEARDGYKCLNSTRDVTRCRFFNSTYQGIGNAFYETSRRHGLKKVRLHWSEHPEKSAGLYMSEGGRLKLLDDKFDWAAFEREKGFEDGYRYVLDGKIRSPWYDVEETRCANRVELAQELDINPAGGDYGFFDKAMLGALKREYCRAPYGKGNVVYDVDMGKVIGWEDTEKGRVDLWITLSEADWERGKCPYDDRNYYAGVDVAAGTGATPSVLTVADGVTGEKALEASDSGMLPHEWASFVVCVCRFFAGRDGDGAFLLWEANGPGREFGIAVKDLGYGNVWRREGGQYDEKGGTRFAGWSNTRETKRLLLGDYRKALTRRLFINRSVRALRECEEYIHLTTGDIEHVSSAHAQDPTGARENHGDRVIADACCWWAMRSRGVGIPIQFQKEEDEDYSKYDLSNPPPDYPGDCLFARMMEVEARAREGDYW